MSGLAWLRGDVAEVMLLSAHMVASVMLLLSEVIGCIYMNGAGHCRYLLETELSFYEGYGFVSFY